MRVALISDLHGNLVAAEAVESDLRRCSPDRIVCLGDVAALGPQPGETIAWLRALGGPVILGNTDAALLDPPPPPSGGGRARRIADLHAWAAARLGEEDRRYLRGFLPTVEIPEFPGGLLCCHGSPRSFEERILATTSDADLAAMLSGTDAGIVAGGHTHQALLRRRPGGTFVNPGSVGLPYALDPRDQGARIRARAEYALLTARGAEISVEFRSVPFSPEAVRSAARRAGVPHLDWWLEWWAESTPAQE